MCHSRVRRVFNAMKTQEMRIQARDGNPLFIRSKDIQQTDFTCAGSIVSVTGGTEEDTSWIINHKSDLSGKRNAVPHDKVEDISFESGLLNGSETWHLTKALLSKLQTFSLSFGQMSSLLVTL